MIFVTGLILRLHKLMYYNALKDIEKNSDPF